VVLCESVIARLGLNRVLAGKERFGR
jgi:hypothetical protein